MIASIEVIRFALNLSLDKCTLIKSFDTLIEDNIH
jgi:hypothetical protein